MRFHARDVLGLEPVARVDETANEIEIEKFGH